MVLLDVLMVSDGIMHARATHPSDWIGECVYDVYDVCEYCLMIENTLTSLMDFMMVC